MVSNDTQPEVQGGSDATTGQGVESPGNNFRAEYLTSLPPIQTASLADRLDQRYPSQLDAAQNDPFSKGDVKTAMLPPEGRKPIADQFDIPQDAETLRIQKSTGEKFESQKPIYEKIIGNRTSDIMDSIKDPNPSPDRLSAEVQKLFRNFDNFKNPGDTSDPGRPAARSDALMQARLSAGTLDQFGQKISGETRDGQTVDFNLDLKEKNVSITIGQGTSQESTMTINAKGQVEMKGPIQNPSDFLRRLKPVSGGRDSV